MSVGGVFGIIISALSPDSFIFDKRAGTIANNKHTAHNNNNTANINSPSLLPLQNSPMPQGTQYTASSLFGSSPGLSTPSPLSSTLYVP